MGVTPMHYLRRLRVEHACNFLRNTTLTLAEIAQEVGVASADHLRRPIVRETGS